MNGSFHRKRRRADVSLACFTCHTPEAVHTQSHLILTALPIPILPVRQLRHRLSNSPQGPQLGSGTEPESCSLHSSRCVLSTRRVCKTPGRRSEQTVHTPHPFTPFTLPYVKRTFEIFFFKNDSLSIPFSFLFSVTTIHRETRRLELACVLRFSEEPHPVWQACGSV